MDTAEDSSNAKVTSFFKRRNSRASSQKVPPPSSSSPRKHFASPKKVSLFQRNSDRNSPRKQSSIPAITFGTIKREDLAPPIDHAPYKDLIHVCQFDFLPKKDDQTSILSSFSQKSVLNYEDVAKFGTTVSDVQTSSSLVGGVCRNGVMRGETEAVPVKIEELLGELQKKHSTVNVQRIMDRYTTIKGQLDTLKKRLQGEEGGVDGCGHQKDENKEHLNNRPKSNIPPPPPPHAKKRKINSTSNHTEKRRKGLTLCCSINITRDSKGLIMVNTGSYLDGGVTPPVFGSEKGAKSPRKRRTSFMLARDKIKSETAAVVVPLTDESTVTATAINKENREPPQSTANTTTIAMETPLTQRNIQPVCPVTLLEKPSCTFGLHLWNDLYQPKQSCDIIGNQEGVGKIFDWLSKWRDRCSNSSAKEQSGKQPTTVLKKGRSSETYPKQQQERVPPISSTGDSDFKVPSRRRTPRVVSVDDSFNSSFCSSGDEDDEMGVALLLCGPVGCGKTAAVYACAHQLGYKVLEINSTHCRTRQALIATLREATQSHRVAIQQAPPIVTKATDPPPPKKKGLMAFFKPKPKPKEDKQSSQQPGGSSSSGGKQVSIETTTLTLLEEVLIIAIPVIIKLINVFLYGL